VRFARLPVDAVRDLGAGHGVVTLRADPPLDAKPGQFVMMHGDWGDAPLLPRPMSLLTSGSKLDILIKRVGEGTRRLLDVRPGDPIDVLGPLGTAFTAPGAGERAVLVAGGVGVAPLAWWANVLASGTGPRPLFLYGGRTKDDLPLSEEILVHSDLHVTTEDGSRGKKGRVSILLGDALGPGTRVYTCGPNAMMAAVAAACGEAGVPCEASLEAPMACGYGVCFGCAIPKATGGYLYACTDGPVVDAKSVAWGTWR
jgi:dihydroorotate dehydrogenase electron transfer subunit